MAGLTAIVGILGIIFTKGKLCLFMAFLTIISLLFLWVPKFPAKKLTISQISFGIHLPVSVAVADFCLSIDQYIIEIANKTIPNSEAAQGLQEVMKCLTNDSYSPVAELSYKGANQTLSSVNSYTVTCCNLYFTEENITDLNVTKFPAEYRPQIRAYMNDYKTYIAIIAEIAEIANCTLVREAFKEIKGSLCGTTM
jgi:hypothetical protein